MVATTITCGSSSAHVMTPWSSRLLVRNRDGDLAWNIDNIDPALSKEQYNSQGLVRKHRSRAGATIAQKRLLSQGIMMRTKCPHVLYLEM